MLVPLPPLETHTYDRVENPADPTKNFADDWGKYPERRGAFFKWVQLALNKLAATCRALMADPLSADEMFACLNSMAPATARPGLERTIVFSLRERRTREHVDEHREIAHDDPGNSSSLDGSAVSVAE